MMTSWLMEWPTVQASLLLTQCPNNTTTYLENPVDTLHPAAEVECFPTATVPIIIPNVLSQWDALYHDTRHCSNANHDHTKRDKTEHKINECNKANCGNADRANNQCDNNDQSATTACQPQYNQQSTPPTDHDNNAPNNHAPAIEERTNDDCIINDQDNNECAKLECKNDECNKADSGNDTQDNEKRDNDDQSPNTEGQPQYSRQPTHPFATNHHPNNPQSPSHRDTRTPDDATLRQLWIVLTQLEEINHQFALLLAMLPIPQHSTTPSLPPVSTRINRGHLKRNGPTTSRFPMTSFLPCPGEVEHSPFQ